MVVRFPDPYQVTAPHTPTKRRRKRPTLGPMAELLRASALSGNGAYEGASRAHPRDQWLPALRSADADLFPDLAIGRARSRDIARNGLGHGNLTTLVNHVIGHRGLWPQSRLSPDLFGGDREKARNVERQIERAIKRKSCRMDAEGRLSRAQLHRLTYRSMLESGDVGWHLIPGPDGDPIIEVIEADRIMTPPGKGPKDGIREGVERDANGAPVAYWVARTHPGDSYQSVRDRKDNIVRVHRFDEVGRPRFILFMESLRPGQTRGMPAFLPCADRYDDRAQGVKAALYQAITSAFLGFVIEQDDNTEAEELDVDEEGRQFEEWDYGAVKRLQPGQRLTAPNISRPGPELANFINATNGEIGASLGMPVEMVSLDFSKTTWHAARQGGLELSRNVRARQEHVVDCGIRIVDQIFVENAVLRGEIEGLTPDMFYSDPESFLDLRYQYPVRGLVNPGEETRASIEAIGAGLSTLHDECAAKGMDYQENLEQLRREQDLKDDLALTTPQVSQQSAQPQQQQPQDDQPDDGDPQDEEDDAQ